MRYEGLARYAFDNCYKAGDPFGIAKQEIFSNFIPTPNEEGKQALSKVLTQLVVKHSTEKFNDEFLELERKVWQAETQREIINIIDRAIQVVENNSYSL